MASKSLGFGQASINFFKQRTNEILSTLEHMAGGTQLHIAGRFRYSASCSAYVCTNPQESPAAECGVVSE